MQEMTDKNKNATVVIKNDNDIIHILDIDDDVNNQQIKEELKPTFVRGKSIIFYRCHNGNN